MENVLENSIDVRIIEPINKHRRIFERFDSLQPGANLLILNDHDPKPLYYQLLAERGNIFDWEYLMNGPEEWRVNIVLRVNNSSESVGQIAAKDIKKVEVFKKYGIDFCCGGKKTLAEVCREKGIDEEVLKNELNSTSNNSSNINQNFNDFPLDFMCDYIVNTHHSYVKNTLPMLVEISDKVAVKHSDRHPELLKINNLVKLMDAELSLHMQKEEIILFPFIKSLVKDGLIDNKDNIRMPITMMEMEHESVGSLLDEMKIFSNDFTPPSNACNSFQLLYNTLKQFDDDLHLHVHLENNILFPKALNLIK